ncbi:MAG TPA: ABC transporter substrate-binding protein [Hyphomicrobiaceae bacterium]|jgi:branched-chain amino acid transport system substrate-binding protein|nr:ABC transporter substrate-binding protein [Hyphomicrobiaceae bacterium]
MLSRVFSLAAVLMAFAVMSDAVGQQTVKVGAIYPLSGNAASAGSYSKAAIELAVEIVNNDHPELKDLPLAAGSGLPGLGGAKIDVVFADNQGTPAAGQNQALRLITEEKVVALIGAYQSGITVTTSAMAERHGVPFVNPESVAANLTERGFKWFFRATPVAGDFARAYADFLKEQKAAGQKVASIAIVNENTEYGNSVASVVREVFAKEGHNVTQVIPYSANTTDVQPQVLQLKEKNPDVVIFVSYTSDAILYAKTMKDLNWKPAIMIADNAGFNDPSFVSTSGALVEGLVNRSSFAPGKPGTLSALVNDLYKKKTNVDLDDASARAMQGMLILADAINRAGSTDAAKIQAALRATDLKASQVVTGYNGVKFDDKGQNILASSLITQMQGGKYVPVWPKDKAAGELKLPYKGW